MTDENTETDQNAETDENTETDSEARTDETLTTGAIEPSAPEEFGLVQLWWGDGKGKTTAAMGMGFRAAGHGHRVHMVQFMKGGAGSVEDIRGEYEAIETMPGFS
ncbi:cob(I)alamin adenolsyltransferase, partial [Halobacteriales archaeon QS_6_71_20]